MKRLLMLALVVVGCGETPAAMMMPDGSGGDTSTRPPPDPNIPLVCQEESWPDCPDGVFYFNDAGHGMRFVDSKTCSSPVTCAICQYVEPGSDCNQGKVRTYHGYCARAKVRQGTCDAPGDDVTSAFFPVFCLDADHAVGDTCPGT